MDQAAAPTDARACPNCGAALAGPFCHGCGQPDRPLDLPVREVVADALGDTLGWDGRVLSTLRVLATAPGRLSVDWAEGRRARRLAPLKLFVLCSVVFAGLSAGYDLAKTWLVDPATVETRDPRDRLDGVAPPAKVDAVDGYLHFMTDLGTQWMFVFMPLGGFGLYVLYGLRRRTYGAHFVVAIHVFSAVVLMLAARRLVQIAAVAVPPHLRLADAAPLANGLLLAAVAGLGLAYAAAAIRRAYGVGWVRAALSAPAVLVAPVAVWLGLLVVGMFAVALWPS